MPPFTLPDAVTIPITYLWVLAPLLLAGFVEVGLALGDLLDACLQRWFGHPDDAPRTWS